MPQSKRDATLLHELFDQVAGRYPNHLAVDVPLGFPSLERTQITYAGLEAQANVLALRLAEMIHGECVVAILLPRNSHWLYAAQLAVLKAGGAYTCLDPAFPDEHLRRTLQEAGVVALLSEGPGLARDGCATVPAGRRFDVPALIATGPRACPAPPPPPWLTPSSLAYVIYTSGTTGRPKGVMIEHRSIFNLVGSDLKEFGVAPGERVAQCSSPAYDSSVEETWLAFAAGATLVPMDDETVRLGPDLVPWLQRERINVLCPPPTLLRTAGPVDAQGSLSALRLLYVGGEALERDVVARWAPGRRLENGYGPTECTVTVVRGRVTPDAPVTIGRPVPGNQAWILDQNLQPVVDGQAGELCITGAGVARGYLNQPELTTQRFPHHPRIGRMYRTGDLVRRTPNGDLEYLGRLDAQVKLRGYRIELGAIEACLAGCPGVREAACTIQGQGAGRLLAAHIVPRDPANPPRISALKEAVSRMLPIYMIPARFGLLTALPKSIGGKLDRRALPEIPAEEKQRTGLLPARNDVERLIAGAFAEALQLDEPPDIQADFFDNLGGESLTAVVVVSILRDQVETARVNVRDLYQARTVRALAELLQHHSFDPAGSAPAPSFPPLAQKSLKDTDGATAPARPVLCTILQTMWLGTGICLASSIAYLVFFMLLPALAESMRLMEIFLLSPILAALGIVIYSPFAVGATLLAKKVLIGRYQPGAIPVWSFPYLRHWMVQQVAASIPWGLLSGTIFTSMVLRLLGARIGKRVHIHRGVALQHGGWDLLSVGDDVTFCQEAAVRLVELDRGHLVIGPVAIGDGATIDVRAGLSGNTVVGSDAHLTELSWLQGGGRIPDGERWKGVPAEPAGRAQAPPPLEAPGLSPGLHGIILITIRLAQGILGWVWLAGLVAAVLIRSHTEVEGLIRALFGEHPQGGSLGIILLVLVLATPLNLAAQALSLRLWGRVRPGVMSRWSFGFIRLWLKTGTVSSAGNWLSGTLFWPFWLRLAGMRVGRGCEISTIVDVVPEAVEIGAESFFADGIYLGCPRICRGTVTVQQTRVGRNTFIGNHTVIPNGQQLPDDLFLGVCTVADAATMHGGSSWFGHPAMELHRRQIVEFDRSLTHEPGVVRRATRVFWESMRFLLPVIGVLPLYAWFWLTLAGRLWLPPVVAASLATIGCGAMLLLIVLMTKWLLLGRVRPGQHPLWSCWCSRWDFLYIVWQFYARPVLVRLEGTLLLPWYLRAAGMRIGRRVALGPGFSQVVDPDMLSFQDEATVNSDFQAHSFEDRVLKIGPVRIRERASTGSGAVVFYGADIGRGVWIGPHGVVMKGERLTAGAYVGCPVGHAACNPVAMEA
jgi:non-ribosomal peptide synthetase-like protein